MQIEHELSLIAELQYEPYFLTVHDIVRFARRRRILCQGRGSAANSAVCYCLGITEVESGPHGRCCSSASSRRERNEPPDIDVDFEHERREEVIQYVYDKYGRERAALTATVITYRRASAVRDVGKALGLSPDQVDALAKIAWHWCDDRRSLPERLREGGLRSRQSPVLRRCCDLVGELIGFPRHLSQHVGGFVISAAAAVAAGADRKRRHGRSHRHPVGQGRPRRARPAQGGRAWRSACSPRSAARFDLVRREHGHPT